MIEGSVPGCLPHALHRTGSYEISADAFLLRLPSGLQFHYRRGDGTTFRRAAGVSDAEVALFHEGTVAGAIAWLNGIVPLHASAVIHRNRVHAFTGVSGEGKSTLVAALQARGMTLFCDDVLLVEPSASDRLIALPGHKRLKLWRDALSLTGATGDERVHPDMDKFYVGDIAADTLPKMDFVRLYELATGEQLAIAPVRGAARFETLRHAFYRPQFVGSLMDEQRYFMLVNQLAGALDLRRFTRPRTTSEFSAGVDAIVADIQNEARTTE